MKKTIIVVLLGIMMSSCGYQLWFKPKYFTYQYDSKSTTLDSLIKINGYYVSDIIVPERDFRYLMDKKDSVIFDPYVELFLLYGDGVIMRTSSKLGRETYENSINKILFDGKKYNSWEYQWGLYQVKNDTIISQFIRDDGPMSLPVVLEKKFLIISDSTLKIIYEKVMNPEYQPNRLEGTCLFHFHPYPNQIESASNPYLRKKWFWNKEAYKNRKDN